MSNFETTAITVAYRGRCEDRVKVLDFDEGVVIAVADGAGGTAGGDQAAETVIREITVSASMGHDEAAWSSILQQIDSRVGVGASTCVVVAVLRVVLSEPAWVTVRPGSSPTANC